ncbi:ead/Ea22-like family protein [Escherichia coli]|uniref:ead/Ea22-like family protein n=1 Tax=Escherichia coli TaxID=562 RepID=UPI003FCEE674
MSNIDKQALREIAAAAVGAHERLSVMPPDDIFDISLAEGTQLDADITALNALNSAANPTTVLALLDELEAKDKVWSAQDNHINQQADRIESLEKKNGDLGRALEAAEKRIAELEARAFNPAILDVIAERQRQQSVEGWMPEHDDEHCNGELAMAAVCYINETGTVNRNGGKPWGWPWDASWWKPNARRRNLVKAGALILAEIERIDRAAGIGKGE